jgi:hypothetical protein
MDAIHTLCKALQLRDMGEDSLSFHVLLFTLTLSLSPRLIACQTLSRLMEMIHMKLYEEESKGLDDPRGYIQGGPRAVT